MEPKVTVLKATLTLDYSNGTAQVISMLEPEIEMTQTVDTVSLYKTGEVGPPVGFERTGLFGLKFEAGWVDKDTKREFLEKSAGYDLVHCGSPKTKGHPISNWTETS